MNNMERKILKRVEDSAIYNIGEYKFFVWPYKGITEIQPDEIRYIVTLLSRAIPKGTDLILSLMTDGIFIAVPLALKLGIPLIVCRTQRYGMKKYVRICQRTRYFERDLYFEKIYRNKRVCIVDTVISTGGSIISVGKKLMELGCKITGIAAVLEKEDYFGNQEIQKKLDIKPTILFRHHFSKHGSEVTRIK